MRARPADGRRCWSREIVYLSPTEAPDEFIDLVVPVPEG